MDTGGITPSRTVRTLIALATAAWLTLTLGTFGAYQEDRKQPVAEDQGSGLRIAPAKVLVIHSYHSGYDWTDDIARGIDEVLGPLGQVELYTIHLDSKRMPLDKAFAAGRELFDRLYAQIPFDAIITSDDNALHFALSLRRKCCPDTPIVFSGLNGYLPKLVLDNQPMTGVVEGIDVEATIEAALALHPNARQLAVVSDPTPTGAAALAAFRRARQAAERQLPVVELVGLSPQELDRALHSMREDTVVFRLSYFTDAMGRRFSSRESYELVARASPWPVYSFWSYGVGFGMVGGKVVSGRHQGETAARLALQILAGEPAWSVDVVEQSPNVFLFDYRLLEHFDAYMPALPEGAVIVGEPEGFFYRYRRLAWMAFGAGAAMTVLVVVLALDVAGRRRAEKRLAHQLFFTRTLVDTIPNPLVVKDRQGRYLDCNRAYERFFGLRKEDLAGKKPTDVFPDELAAVYEEMDASLRDNPGEQVFEAKVLRSDGQEVPAQFFRAPYYDERGEVEGMVGVVVDISEQKRIQAALEAHEVGLRAEVAKRTAELEESGSKLDQIVSSNSDGLVVTRPGGRVVFANPAARSMLGLDDGNLENITLIPDSQGPNELTVLDASGNLRYCEMRTSSVMWEGEEGMLVSLRDVTERNAVLEELSRANQVLFSHIDNTPLAVIEWDRELRAVRWSGRAEEMFGFACQETDGLFWRDIGIVHPEDEAKFEEAMAELVSGATPRNAHYFLGYHRLGGVLFTEWHNSAVLDGEGRLVSVLSLVQDVSMQRKAELELKRAHDELENRVQQRTIELTRAYENLKQETAERKQAERSLRQSERNYRMLAENYPGGGVFLFDFDLRHTLAGGLGLPKSVFGSGEVEGKTPCEVYPAPLCHQVQPVYEGALGGHFGSVDLSLADGVFELRTLPIRDEEGRVDMGMAVLLDVSERENALRDVKNQRRELYQALSDAEEARERIDTILKSVADGLVVTDNAGRIVLMNPTAEDILGVRLSRTIGERLERCIKNETLRDSLRRNIPKARDAKGYQFDFEVERASGPSRYYQARTSVVSDGQGNQRGTVITIQDVTSERAIDRMKTEFISTAAHELRTPLTSVQGFSELLMERNDLDREEQRRFLGYIHEQSLSLAGIINDLLDISRIESGKGFSLNPEPADLAELVRAKVESYEAQRREGFVFELDLPAAVAVAEVDARKFDQLLDNLISNAIKYSPEGGTVSVRLEPAARGYRIAVRDTGRGMSPEQVERVFEKFYRGHAASGTIPGTGLGMTIVKHIVEAHSGEVFIDSSEGAGTEVSFTVPSVLAAAPGAPQTENRPSLHAGGG